MQAAGNRCLYIVAAMIQCATCVCLATEAKRVLHFPRDRSLGKVLIIDSRNLNEAKEFDWRYASAQDFEFLADARGNVTIPAGKLVHLLVFDKNLQNIDGLATLRCDDLYKLTIGRGESTSAGKDAGWMECLAGLSELKVLDIQSANVSNKGLFRIRGLQNLEQLYLGEGITNSGMRIVGKFNKLKVLNVRCQYLTGKGLEELKGLDAIEEFHISFKKPIGEGILPLTQMKSLRYLAIGCSDSEMRYLKNMKSLRRLRLGGEITDTGVKYLSEHPKLEEINLHWNENITNEGVKYLGKMESLKILDITSSGINDKGMEYLKDLTTLEELVLPPCGITDAGVVYLSNLKKLKYLSMAHNRGKPENRGKTITDKGLEYIYNLTNLERLEIRSKHITDAGMGHLSKLKNLKLLMLYDCSVTNDGMAGLSGLSRLETISLHKTNITISGLNKLNSLGNLKYINVRPIKKDGSVMDISGLTRLEKLQLGPAHISKDSISDDDLKCLSGLWNLKDLRIVNTMRDSNRAITDNGLRHIAGLVNLEHLSIGGPKITNDGLKYLSRMKKLWSLSLYGGSLTDEGLRHLESLSRLGMLSIYGEDDISDEALGRLERKMPNLHTIRIRRDENRKDKAEKESSSTDSKHPTAMELLDKYAATQDKISNCIIKSDNTIKSYDSALNERVENFLEEEFRYNGNRFSIKHKHRQIPDTISPNRTNNKNGIAYLQSLWDGERFFLYSFGGRKPGKDMVIIRYDIKTPSEYNGAATFGFLNRDLTRIDKILKQAKDVRVEKKMTTVQKLSCYVISAKTMHGRYKLWIAPERDYHIVKADSIKSPGSLYKGDTLPLDVTLQNTMEITDFKQFDEKWVPMAFSIKEKNTWVNKGKKLFRTGRHVHRRKEFSLNPNHEKLGSFSSGHIRNGTTVGILGASKDHYWKNGTVVDENGNEVNVKSILQKN